jgi:hypothetical protein
VVGEQGSWDVSYQSHAVAPLGVKEPRRDCWIFAVPNRAGDAAQSRAALAKWFGEMARALSTPGAENKLPPSPQEILNAALDTPEKMAKFREDFDRVGKEVEKKNKASAN